MLPNWILVSAAHLTLFMEFFSEKSVVSNSDNTSEELEANKSVLAEQMGVTLSLIHI